VSAPQRDEALEVLMQVAHDSQAPFTLVGRDITFRPLSHSLDVQSLRVSQGDRDLDITIPLLGAHQIQNAATAVAALRLMNEAGTEIRDVDILKGFAEVKWPGRFQVARREPPVILDSAHNQDSFARLRQALDDYFPGRRGYLVFGASEDKNIPGMFEEIRGKIIEAIITKADHPRALEPDAIAALAAELGIPHRIMMPVRSAFVEALGRAEKDGSIVISAGSMFVTAEAMAAWNAYQAAGARPAP
jgi:dihydrofolate synthase/folylpolyglutamate synthase